MRLIGLFSSPSLQSPAQPPAVIEPNARNEAARSFCHIQCSSLFIVHQSSTSTDQHKPKDVPGAIRQVFTALSGLRQANAATKTNDQTMLRSQPQLLPLFQLSLRRRYWYRG
uniref:Uncharacterized protein n=1 Tax=Plectus sambesii TaxID=2011161 RepID=A0A914WWX4_9BILA